MKKIICLLVLVGVMLGCGSAVLAYDGFYVVGGAGRVGTAITSLPYAITKPGFYYLNGNLTLSTPGYGITVQASNVTIDLMGFCMTGPGSTDSNYAGIGVYGGYANVEIRNGYITNWTGTGTNPGKAVLSVGVTNVRVIGIMATNCAIGFNLGTYSLVASCTVQNMTRQGIVIGTGSGVKGNNLSNCATNGTFINSIDCLSGGCVVDGNIVNGPSNSSGISTSDNTRVTNNVVTGCNNGVGIKTGNYCNITGNTSFTTAAEIYEGLIAQNHCTILNNTLSNLVYGTNCTVVNNTL